MNVATTNAWVYEEDGHPVYRAFSIGECLTSLVAARLGENAFPANEQMQKAYDDSSAAEEEALVAYRRITGHDVIWRQKTVELVIGADSQPLAVIRGHLDGLDREEDCITEVKSFGKTYWNQYNSNGLGALGAYGLKITWQMALYGHATGRGVRLVIYNKHATDAEREEGADIIIEPTVDPETLVPLSVIKTRVLEVEDYAARDEIPSCDRDCRPGSAYEHVHEFASFQMGGDALLAKLERYEELRTILGNGRADDLENGGLIGEFERLKNSIKDEYGDGKHAAGMFTATIVPSNGKKYIDGKLLKQMYPDVHASVEKIGRPYKTLTVRRQGGGK